MKKKLLWLLLVIIVIVSLVMVLFVKINHKSNIVAQFEKTIINQDLNQMKQLFQMEDSGVLDEVPLKHFMEYLHKNDDKLQEVITSIQEQVDTQRQNTDALVQLSIGEKEFGLFSIDQLVLRENYIQVERFTGEQIDVQTPYALLEKQSESKLQYGPIFPGEHVIELRFNHELGVFRTEEQIEVWNQEKIRLTLDEEEIIQKDASLKDELYNMGATFTKQLQELKNQELQHELFSDRLENLNPLTKEMNQILTTDEPLHFKEVIIDEASYNISNLHDIWFAEVRMIGVYETEGQAANEEAEFVLFTFELFFDSLYDEWFISDVRLSYTEQSVIDLWDSELKFEAKDLDEMKNIDSFM